MSNPEEDTAELKAGHPPAVKVGNVRIPNKRNDSGSEKISGDELAKQAAEFGSESHEKPDTVVISGAVTKALFGNNHPSDDKVYTPEAIKAYHDKPQVCHEKSHAPTHHNIQQPRKQ